MTEDKLAIKQKGEGVTFSVKVVPNISAVAQKGKANQALIKLLAKALGCPKSSLSIISGTTRPQKEVFVANMTKAKLESRLSEYLG